MEQDNSEWLNQITLVDMELVPNTPHIHFEFLGMPNAGGNKLKVIKNVHVSLK